jgi:hypothetical protein
MGSILHSQVKGMCHENACNEHWAVHAELESVDFERNRTYLMRRLKTGRVAWKSAMQTAQKTSHTVLHRVFPVVSAVR